MMAKKKREKDIAEEAIDAIWQVSFLMFGGGKVK